jgi:hypothetical protein
MKLESNRTVIQLMDTYNSSVDPELRVPLPRVEQVKKKQLKGPSQNPPPPRNREQPVDIGPVVPPPIVVRPLDPVRPYQWSWDVKGGDCGVTEGLEMVTIGFGVPGSVIGLMFMLFTFCLNDRVRLDPTHQKNLKPVWRFITFLCSTASFAKVCNVALKNLNKKTRDEWRRQQGIRYLNLNP